MSTPNKEHSQVVTPDCISVIITTYNQPDWLRKTLWGFENQTLSGFEVVIADDGSGNETKNLVDWFIESSSLKIKHIWHPDDGFRKCTILNKAIIASSGDYLIFTDGDCIPRNDFVEVHARFSKQKHFLSGGYFKLTHEISKLIDQNDIIKGNPFSSRWLLSNGQPLIYKFIKLNRKDSIKWVMNHFTTTKATWNGHNSSGWKKDIMAVNGFNETMQYGGLDRELGERLVNFGVKPKQIRYSAVCVHLDHPRPYKNNEALNRNIQIRKVVKQTKVTWTEQGISQHVSN